MGSATLAFDAAAAHAAADDAADRGGAERSDRDLEREEDLPGVGARASLAEIARQGLSDAARQREPGGAPRLGTAHPERLCLPVDVIQPQRLRLARAQSVNGERQQERPVAYIRWPVARGGREQAPQVFWGGSCRQRDSFVDTGSRDRRGQPRRAPAADCGEAQERA